MKKSLIKKWLTNLSDLLKGGLFFLFKKTPKKSLFCCIVFLLIGIVLTYLYLNVGNKNNDFKEDPVSIIDKAAELSFQRNNQEAIELLSDVKFETKDQQIQAKKILAESYYSLKEYERSIEEFKIVLDLTTDAYSCSSLQNQIANCYRDLGQKELAKSYYQKALDDNQKNATAWVNYIFLEYSSGDKSKAIAITDKALIALPANQEIKAINLKVKK